MIRCAEAPWAASIITRSSIRASFGVIPEDSLAAAACLCCLPLRVPLDVVLIGAGDSQGARRDVPGDHRSGSSVGRIPDIYRRDQGRVNRDSDVVADHRAVFAESIPVGGDRAGADVGVLTDLRVADVGEVRDLASGPDIGFLDLDE